MQGLPVWLSTLILGLGTVFVGLICLIFITKLMSLLYTAFADRKAPEPVDKPADGQTDIADRAAFSAAVASCIATVMGSEIDGLRIVSIKKSELTERRK